MKNLTASLKKIMEIVHKDVDVIDAGGLVIDSSIPDRVGMVISPCEDGKAVIDTKGHIYVAIDGGTLEEVNLAQLILKDRAIGGTADSYQQFLINILDEIEPGEENSRFGISKESGYIVYRIDLANREHFSDAYSLISNSFYGHKQKWVFPYRGSIVLVEGREIFSEDIYTNANTIKDMVNSEVFAGIYEGVGNIQNGTIGIKKSFEEAGEAIRVGREFSKPDNIFIYKDLFIERIVDTIPDDKLKEFEKEVMKKGFQDIFDGEMIKTVDVLFKNNLNISDSARILYIHRNTLLYRIEKIQRITGLDLRKFEDAVKFKLIFLLKQVNKL